MNSLDRRYQNYELSMHVKITVPSFFDLAQFVMAFVSPILFFENEYKEIWTLVK